LNIKISSSACDCVAQKKHSSGILSKNKIISSSANPSQKAPNFG